MLFRALFDGRTTRMRTTIWMLLEPRTITISALFFFGLSAYAQVAGAVSGSQVTTAGPVADTVLSPLGGYGTAPPPAKCPYDAPDFSPLTALNRELPRWIQLGLEERFRFESYTGGGFKPG